MTSRPEQKVAWAIEEWLEERGLVMVPRPAKGEMVYEGVNHYGMNPDAPDEEVETIYYAMLTAAPTPDTQSLAATMIKVFTEVYDDDG